MTLHFPTVLAVCALAAVLIALVMLAGEWRGRRHNGVGVMALGVLLMAAGFIIFGARGTAPAWITYVLGNGTLAASALAYLHALGRLYDRRNRMLERMSIAGLALVLLVNLAFAATLGDTHVRSGLSGILVGLLFSLNGFALRRRFEARYGAMHRVVAWSFLAGSAVQVVQACWDLLIAGPETFRVQENPVDVFLALTLVVWIVLGSYGFLLMLRERDLLELAMLDGLTGLLNRRALLEATEGALALARRSGESCSLLLADLDHFKRVNDAHGHDAGDEVLRHFAALVRSVMRREDVPGRYGGEEFTLFLPGVAGEGALALAQRLRHALAAQPARLAHGELRYTASIGIAEWRPGTPADVGLLLKQADQALYAAKAGGRDRALRFDSSMRPA